MVDVFKQIPMLVDWAKGVQDHMTKLAIEGKKWKGLKLVHGRSQRKWKEDKEVVKILTENRYSKVQANVLVVARSVSFVTTKIDVAAPSHGTADFDFIVSRDQVEPVLLDQFCAEREIGYLDCTPLPDAEGKEGFNIVRDV